MKYIVEGSTDLYQKIKDVFDHANTIRTKCVDLCNQLGAETFASDTSYIAGSIVGFEFNEKPEGWKQVLKRRYSNMYFPKSIKPNRDLINQIESIERVSTKPLKDLLEYGNYLGPGGRFSTIPGMYMKNGFILIDVPDWADYTPVEGMTEILVSKWKKLKDQEVETV